MRSINWSISLTASVDEDHRSLRRGVHFDPREFLFFFLVRLEIAGGIHQPSKHGLWQNLRPLGKDFC